MLRRLGWQGEWGGVESHEPRATSGEPRAEKSSVVYAFDAAAYFEGDGVEDPSFPVHEGQRMGSWLWSPCDDTSGGAEVFPVECPSGRSAGRLGPGEEPLRARRLDVLGESHGLGHDPCGRGTRAGWSALCIEPGVKVQAKSCAASRSSCCKRRAKEVVLLGSRPCHLGDGRHREDAMKTGAFTRLAILRGGLRGPRRGHLHGQRSGAARAQGDRPGGWHVGRHPLRRAVRGLAPRERAARRRADDPDEDRPDPFSMTP